MSLGDTRKIVTGEMSSFGDVHLSKDIISQVSLARAVLSLAFSDLKDKRHSMDYKSAKRFLIGDTKKQKELREMFCCAANIDADAVREKAEQYAYAY